MTQDIALNLPVFATIAFPALAALVTLALARRKVGRDVAVIAGVLALVSAAYRVVTVEGPVTGSGRPVLTIGSGIPAIDLGELTIPFEIAIGPRTALVSLVVALVTLAVLAFSTWYLREDDRLGVFLATVSLFAAAMQLVVHSGDLVFTLVGWEVMGFCSYLLIGHWSRTERARRAAYKSFIVTRLADVGFVLAVVILAAGAGSTGYDQVVTHWVANPGPALTVAMAALVVGVLGKSAQVPFQDWLPDAMAGPTPASALIHAATMVAAGTVVLVQLSLLLSLAPGAQWLLAASVAVTMLLGAVLAIGQRDLKALLAWSTVSQVAIMLAPLAVGADLVSDAAALFHLYAHALFKALLFLTLGVVSLAVHSTAAARLQGAAKTVVTKAAVVVGLASLAGLPLVVGGWSKELVLATVADEAAAAGVRAWMVLAALVVTVILTAMYATRAALILLRPAPGSPQTPTTGAVYPATPTIVIGGLTLASATGGTLLLGFDRFLGVEAHVSLLWLTSTAALAALGAALAWRLSRTGDLAVRLGRRQDSFDAGLGVDRLYLAVVAAPILALARGVARLDHGVVDAPVRAAARKAVDLSDSVGESHPSAPISAVTMVAVGLLMLLTLALMVSAGGS